jgi:hypothetical protein
MVVAGVIEVSDSRSEYRVKPLLFSIQPYLICYAESELSVGASRAARYAASELKSGCEMCVGKGF